ncbi:uncharacterized protein J3D65DRAFT_335581 [Phyllosticta citribraziliensis]|uniref:Uncharacterized protein n=1 Tax=Phyllosticta citribraziliensis TaxID=989973 RepID=A0ABR1LWY4_9PEZI
MRAWHGAAFLHGRCSGGRSSPCRHGSGVRYPGFLFGCMAWRLRGWMGLDPLWVLPLTVLQVQLDWSGALVDFNRKWMGQVSCRPWNEGHVKLEKMALVHLRRILQLQDVTYAAVLGQLDAVTTRMAASNPRVHRPPTAASKTLAQHCCISTCQTLQKHFVALHHTQETTVPRHSHAPSAFYVVPSLLPFHPTPFHSSPPQSFLPPARQFPTPTHLPHHHQTVKDTSQSAAQTSCQARPAADHAAVVWQHEDRSGGQRTGNEIKEIEFVHACVCEASASPQLPYVWMYVDGGSHPRAPLHARTFGKELPGWW